MAIARETMELRRRYNQFASMQAEAIALSPACPWISRPKKLGWRAMVKRWVWNLEGWMMRWDARFRSRYFDRGGCFMERCTAQEFYQ